MSLHIPPINTEREALAQAVMALRSNVMNRYIRNRYSFLPKDQQDEIENKYLNIIYDLDETIRAVDQGEKVASWKLEKSSSFTVKCIDCQMESKVNGENAEQAVKQLKDWMWTLSDSGPLCPYCSPDEEASAK